MKINNPNDLGAISSPNTKSTGALESAIQRDAARGIEHAGGDRAELSGLAGKISGAFSQDTVNRTSKVEQLRGQVVEGGYLPDPAEISRGLVDDALEYAATAGGSLR